MCCILGLKGFAVVTCSIIVSLCNRTGEERRRQTLCDKCDNVLFEKCFRQTPLSFKQILL